MPIFEVGGLKRFNPDQPVDVVGPIQQRFADAYQAATAPLRVQPQQATPPSILPGRPAPQIQSDVILSGIATEIVTGNLTRDLFGPNRLASLPQPGATAEVGGDGNERIKSHVTEAWRSDP